MSTSCVLICRFPTFSIGTGSITEPGAKLSGQQATANLIVLRFYFIFWFFVFEDRISL